LKLLENCAFQCSATLVIATHDRRVQEALPAAMVYRIGHRAAQGSVAAA
jgi:putative ABC transport system ATP-binding protein